MKGGWTGWAGEQDAQWEPGCARGGRARMGVGERGWGLGHEGEARGMKAGPQDMKVGPRVGAMARRWGPSRDA